MYIFWLAIYIKWSFKEKKETIISRSLIPSCNDELLKKRHVSGESLPLPNMVSNSAVATWLHFLQMDQYLTDFLDNGYDDLETAKKVGFLTKFCMLQILYLPSFNENFLMC